MNQERKNYLKQSEKKQRLRKNLPKVRKQSENISPGPKLIMESISTLKELCDEDSTGEYNINNEEKSSQIYWIECNVDNDYTGK